MARKPKPPGARRSVVFPVVRQKIIDALRNGAQRTDAATFAGITPSLLKQWVYRGRQGMEPYITFVTEVESAEAEAVLRMTQIVFTAAAKDWRAALEWLKRNRRDVWGDKVEVRIEDVRDQARRIARERGLDEAEMVARAEEILRGAAT
jgi:hypothetical protein